MFALLPIFWLCSGFLVTKDLGCYYFGSYASLRGCFPSCVAVKKAICHIWRNCLWSYSMCSWDPYRRRRLQIRCPYQQAIVSLSLDTVCEYNCMPRAIIEQVINRNSPQLVTKLKHVIVSTNCYSILMFSFNLLK